MFSSAIYCIKSLLLYNTCGKSQVVFLNFLNVNVFSVFILRLFISFTITAYFVNLLLNKPKQAFLPFGNHVRPPTDRKIKLRVKPFLSIKRRQKSVVYSFVSSLFTRGLCQLWVEEHVFVEDRMGTYVNV